MAKKVCDFCLSEGKGLFSGFEKLADGHYICKDCKAIIQEYDLPLKYDLFQSLVTAQPNMKDMIMDVYLEKNSADDAFGKYFPMPSVLMHGGERCINTTKASITVDKDAIPTTTAVQTVVEVAKNTIHNISDAKSENSEVVYGTIYETDAALYFISDHFVNCHRLGYMERNNNDTDRIVVVTPSKKFTYNIDHADLFYLRERFFQKANAAKHNKRQHLIYMTNDNKVTITPGVYEIPRSLRPGKYKVKAIKDAGLHIKDQLGRVRDYYENEDLIDLSDGGQLECTGEYQLQWIGENPEE